MRKLLWLLVLCPALSRAHAQCTLAANASQSAIQTAMGTAATNSCGGSAPNTVQFVAGNSSITSQVSIPCPGSAGLIIQGPVLPTNVWPPAPTAVLTNNGITNNWGFSGGSCNNPVTIQYLEWNGNQPSGGGGGFLHIPLGMNKVTLRWNYIHGNMAIQTTQQRPDTFVYLDGSYGSTHTQNTTIQNNQFGSTGSGDCGGNATSATGKGVMSLMGGGGGPGTCTSGYRPPAGGGTCLYQGFPNDNSGGGSCAAFGLAVNTDNFKFINNSVQEQEQGGKCFQNNGGTTTSTNTLLQFNDFSGIHRIGYEAQCNDGLTTVDSNDFHDPFQPNANSWALSVPQGNTASTNNVVVANVAIQNDRNGNPASYAGCGIEFWGGLTSANNLIQGRMLCGIAWGFQPGGASINNNTIQMNLSNQYISCCDQGASNPPSQSGNVTGSTVSAQTSVAPTISPTPTGTYSSPISVTITDNGYTTGALPKGNTSIYYTTDGSTPTTSSTWCASPCGITVSPGATVNAIGMWGAINQPRSYPSGFGFVPSAVVGAHYSAGSTPVLTGVSLSMTGGATSIQTSNSLQACATATYSGVAAIVTCGNGPDTYGTTFGTWTSSVGADATISSTGLVLGVAAGSTNLGVKATQGSTTFTSSPFALTVTNPTPVLTGVTISDGGVSTIAYTQSVQAAATAQYTQSVTTNCTASPDAYGTTCGNWISSNTGAATISSTGLISGVSAGSTSLTVKATPASGSAITSATPLALTVTGTPPAATLTGVSVSCASASVQAGNTDACAATCTYNTAPSTNCTVTDSHGTTAGSWASSSTAAATINSTTGVATGVAAGSTSITVQAGTFTSPGYTLTVTAIPPVTLILGDPNFDTSGNTSPSYINGSYAVTGTNPGGYTVTSCTFYLPAGSYTAGSKWDCGLVRAPTPTTQATSWLCHNTYTNAGNSSDVGWHTVTLATCGVLPVSTAYWVDVITNHPGRPGQGFSTCGGASCAGSAPTIGNGTYPYRYISQTYGVYTGMGTAMNASGTPGQQSSQYVTLANPGPALNGAFLANPGPTLLISVNGAVLFSAFCTYSDNTVNLCYPTPDQYGNTVTQWTSDAPSVVAVGDIGSSHPGLAIGMTAGTANITATMTGGVISTPWALSVSSTPLPYPPATPRGLHK